VPIQTDTPDVWTPPVWQEGPDGLVADAKNELWTEYQDLNTVLSTGAGGAGGGDSMSGNATAPQNESDQLISTQPMGHDTSVIGEWKKGLQELKSTEPLDSWEGGGSPPMNPAP
jgi:hypothetical protein